MLLLRSRLLQAHEPEPTPRQSRAPGTDLPLPEVQAGVHRIERTGQPPGERKLRRLSLPAAGRGAVRSGVCEPAKDHAVSAASSSGDLLEEER